MALTKVPQHLLDQAFPLRWVGTTAEREAMTKDDVLACELKYFYLQKDEGLTNKLFLLTAIEEDGLTWEAAGGGVDAVTMDQVTGLQDALDTKLEKTDIVATEGTGVSVTASEEDGNNTVTVAGITATDEVLGVMRFATEAEYNTGTSVVNPVTVKQVKDSLALKLDADISSFDEATAEDDDIDATTDLLVIRVGDTNKKITAAQFKELITDDKERLFKGYFATGDALTAATVTAPSSEGADDGVYPAAGSYAIVEETDSVWAWDSDTKTWSDSKVHGVVDATTQVIAGTGLEGGGALATDVTLNVVYGDEASTACEGNDDRLLPLIKWTGTSTERAAITADTTTDVDLGKIFMETGVAGTATFYVLASREPAVTWTAIRQPVSTVLSETGTVSANSNTITLTNSVTNASHFIEVFLCGVKQMQNSWTLGEAEGKKVITLGGNVPQDVEYDVVMYPL